MSARPAPKWRAVQERAAGCLDLARLLAVAVDDLEVPGSGAGTRLTRRVELVVESLERAAKTAGRRLKEQQAAEERAERVRAKQAERERLIEEIRGSSAGLVSNARRRALRELVAALEANGVMEERAEEQDFANRLKRIAGRIDQVGGAGRKAAAQVASRPAA